MNISRSLAILLALSALLSVPAQAGPNMKPGLWKMSTQVEMPGMPMQMPMVTYTKCLSEKDVVPQAGDARNNCKMSSSNVQGDTVTWRMECSNPGGPVTMDGRATFRGNTMEGAVKVNQAGQMMTQRISGKWTGLCR